MAISHYIVSATRPRSFISIFQLGLAAMLHKQYGSKHLLNALSNVGFCSSYNDVLMFEASVLHDLQVRDLSDSYVQFVDDHSIGGIMCVTRSSSIGYNKAVEKLKKMPSASSLGSFGFVSLSYFERKNSEGLKKIVVENMFMENTAVSQIVIKNEDFLWLYGKSKNGTEIKGWSGFMEDIFEERHYTVSKVIPEKFINNPSSSYDTINTVLREADKICKAQGQKHTFVTFD